MSWKRLAVALLLLPLSAPSAGAEIWTLTHAFGRPAAQAVAKPGSEDAAATRIVAFCTRQGVPGVSFARRPGLPAGRTLGVIVETDAGRAEAVGVTNPDGVLAVEGREAAAILRRLADARRAATVRFAEELAFGPVPVRGSTRAYAHLRAGCPGLRRAERDRDRIAALGGEIPRPGALTEGAGAPPALPKGVAPAEGADARRKEAMPPSGALPNAVARLNEVARQNVDGAPLPGSDAVDGDDAPGAQDGGAVAAPTPNADGGAAPVISLLPSPGEGSALGTLPGAAEPGLRPLQNATGALEAGPPAPISAPSDDAPAAAGAVEVPREAAAGGVLRQGEAVAAGEGRAEPRAEVILPRRNLLPAPAQPRRLPPGAYPRTPGGGLLVQPGR